MESVSFVVYGIPSPKGSKTAVVRNGKAVLLDARRGNSRRAFGLWAAAVERAAREASVTLDGPLNLCARFFMPRPKARKRNVWCTTRPDLDKCLRLVGDKLVDAGMIRDDSIIVSFNGSEKKYAAIGSAIGEPEGPRAEITLTRVADSL